MEKLRLERVHFTTGTGKCVYLVGANFWPSKTGPFMYSERWDPGSVGKDLDELASLGANCARLFCFWPEFMPTEGTVDAHALERLREMISLCAASGMWAIPTLFVGHMSGENWHPVWAQGCDYYSDERLLQAQELFIRAVCGSYVEDARVAAWLLSNEWPLFAKATDEKHGIAWAKRMCDAARSADPSHAVSTGDGAWDIVWGQETGLPARRMRDVVDFFGPHFYPKDADALRQSLVASFSMRMAQPFGKPVLLEEFGCSSDQAYDPNAADYYRTALWSAFGAANCGALAWCSHDFDELRRRRPYSHHPYELHFGMIRHDGSRKPQAEEFARFAAFVRQHDPAVWLPEVPRAAIARTSFYLESFPFDWGWTKPELRNLYLQAYANCVRAGFEARFADLDRNVESDVLIVPCLQQLTTRDADQLEAFARAGGTVYVSYGGEPWHPDLESLIGARPLIEYGVVELARASTLELTMKVALGDVPAGRSLRVAVRGDARRGARLPVLPTQAAVVAIDGAGRPAILERKCGSGNVIFCAYPLEYYALHGRDSAVAGTWRLYRAIAESRDIASYFRGTPPCVQVFAWRHHADARIRRLLAVNHGSEALVVRLRAASGAFDVIAQTPLTDERIALPAKGVCVLEVNVPA